MKNAICYLLLLLPLWGCSQHQSNEISGIDIVGEVDRLKNFKDEPIYQLKIHTAYTFTVLINDIPIANKVPYLNHYTALINPCIPAMGEQQIEIRIYPRYADMDTQRDFMENDIDFELTIEKTAWKDGSLEEPAVIYTYRLPEGDYSTQKSVVQSDVFTADVPYELIDWRKGKTFNEKDTTMLKAKTLQVYEALISHYENQRGEDFVNAIGKGIFNLYQASYFNKEEALDHINHSISFINKKKRDLAEISNYQLEILGNGKLLSLKRTDGINREEGVIRRYYQKNRKEKVHIYDVLLYAPPSSSKDENLEVIWHTNLVRPSFNK